MRTFLGQNFLIDTEIQNKIVDLFHPTSAWAEIGPGRGALTNLLIEKFGEVTVFEKDERLVSEWRSRPRVKVIAGDFLDWDFCIASEPVKDFSFIGNLPYESGTAMVSRFCEKSEQVNHFVVMLQKEVVERMTAQPRSRDFGALSVFVQGQFNTHLALKVGPEAFEPRPKVQSLVMVCHRRESGRHPQTAEFMRFVQMSFQNKRKTLKNAWRSFLPAGLFEASVAKFGWNLQIRAEEIAVDQWPEIYQYVEDWKKSDV
jgi:16S rRNA (adenine1518-N6/adenine1519-N6)-dimethyltransferase